MKVHALFDPATYTLTYVVYDEATRDAVVIDPVLDYDAGAAATSTTSLDALGAFVAQHGLRVHFALETHAHADHVSGGAVLRKRLGAQVIVGARITEVQRTFRGVFDLGDAFAIDGSQFDRLVTEGERLEAGSLSVGVLETPGHTPACVSFLIGDAVFTGDALFVEDYGTGRCDFPAGSASALYTSVHERLYALPDETRVFVGHDYQPGGRELRFETTIGASRAHNVHIRQDTSRAQFVHLRESRDATLAPPRLLFPSVQLNVNGGRLPPAHANGRRYLSVPLNLFRPATEDDV
ncbi:MAG: MBL fold metallo-hydrolase [Myxococcales bacterium]|nr:MBL fold metallo-hydrolase [Myxococcales bacterium]